MALRQHWWTVFTALLLLACGIAAASLPHGYALDAFSDLSQLLLIGFATALMAMNATRTRGQTRLFWVLMAVGGLLWIGNMAAWTAYEVFLRKEVPDPFLADIVLFLHIVPFMAAVALRPHRLQGEMKLHFSTLNFLMLLIWWMFLYAFIVFPDEYIVYKANLSNYDTLYSVENLVLVLALGLLAAHAQGAWKKVYWNLFLASGLYTLSSLATNQAIAHHQYYSGSSYDIPFVGSICWMIFAALTARQLNPTSETQPQAANRWLAMSPRLAMLAILSLPLMGFWSQFISTAPPSIRHFRLLATLAAMLVLGVFVFLRQYLLDRELMRLLQESQTSFENLKRLQTQLVQREKLASLGQMVAGAAHEINNPVAAILGYSELLALNRDLNPAQATMAQKIGHQARRTRDLVSGLLDFAQQTPAAKTLVDVSSLLARSLQMKILQLETKGLRVESEIATDLPKVWGNSNQIMQCCMEIIDNAMDALEAAGRGRLAVGAKREGNEIVLRFSDNGPGIKDATRVFDPFYTTKPIGKGTGLGLSAAYGIMQDHRGQISCHNRAEGGAVFILRFPVPGYGASITDTPETAETAAVPE